MAFRESEQVERRYHVAAIWSLVSGLCCLVLLTAQASAQSRAVVELFTSQGCSSCPPADRLVGELAKDPSVIALSLPIDYWDYLGWKDTLADAKFTARQRAYARARGDREVYTPQAIVNGAVPVVGSDRPGIERAIAETRKTVGAMSVPVSVTVSGGQLKVSVPESASTAAGEVWMCAVSRSVPISITKGENRGQQVVYHNVVRKWVKVGDFAGKAANWNVPVEAIAGNDVDAAVVYVQSGSHEKPGPMMGAALAALN